jgi:hypothetical protein
MKKEKNMKTIVVQIEDDIFEEITAFLKLFPENRVKVITDIEHYISFDEKEKDDDFEGLLKDTERFDIRRT